MIARSHIEEDLQLKQFARSGANTKPRFDWTPHDSTEIGRAHV